MRTYLYILLLLVSAITYSQENQKIDSLINKIKTLEEEIDIIKSDIQTEIKNSGYLIKTKSKSSRSIIKLLDKTNGNVIDTIPNNGNILIFDETKRFYKIKSNNKIGFVKKSKLQIKEVIALKYLTSIPKQKRRSGLSNWYNKYSTSTKKKSLNYSKPVKVRGHYRTTKSGKRIYVRSHTRKRRRN
ncbi:hypothetical protein ACWGOQ_0006070 [Aquimarina sp. M1]